MGTQAGVLGRVDFKQQFHSPRGFIPPFLSKLQNPSNKFADGRKRRSLIFFFFKYKQLHVAAELTSL